MRSLTDFGPYFALGRVLATFALGTDSVAGRPLLRRAATRNGSPVPLGRDAVSGTGHFCAGHMNPVRWPLRCAGLRWDLKARLESIIFTEDSVFPLDEADPLARKALLGPVMGPAGTAFAEIWE